MQAFAITTVHVCRRLGEFDKNDRKKIVVEPIIDVVPAGKIFDIDQVGFDDLAKVGAIRKPTRMDRALAAASDDELDAVETVSGRPIPVGDDLPSDDELEAMTRTELDALAHKRGVDISKAKNKPDVIDALVASVS